MDFSVSQSQVTETTFTVLRNQTMSLAMLPYNFPVHFKDTNGHEINHQLLHSSSNDNYQTDSSQTFQIFARLNNFPWEKDRKVHWAPNIPTMVARNRLGKVIHVPSHNWTPETTKPFQLEFSQIG